MAKPARTQERKPRKSIWVSGEYFDYTLLFVVLFLVAFGLVMIYSTSSYKSTTTFGYSYYYIKRQGMMAVAGVFIMLFISKIDYHFWKNFSVIIAVAATIMVLLATFWGSEAGGSSRWLSIGPLRFQPSEVAKLAIIMFTAHIVTKYVKKIGQIKYLIIAAIVPMIIVGIIAMENLSTAIICFGIIVVILFVASPKYWHFGLIGIIGIILGFAFIKLFAYRAERIDAWLHVETHPKGYQTLQSLYAIGSGGIFGKGLGQSIQKLGFIPESHNDMIFSVVCEELGLFGATCVITIFIILLLRFVFIASKAPDLYGALLVVGSLAHIAVQVLINIAVVTNSIPPTGVPLPFISYGGTSLVILLGEMGLVLSVSRQIKADKL